MLPRRAATLRVARGDRQRGDAAFRREFRFGETVLAGARLLWRARAGNRQTGFQRRAIGQGGENVDDVLDARDESSALRHRVNDDRVARNRQRERSLLGVIRLIGHGNFETEIGAVFGQSARCEIIRQYERE